MLLSPVMAEHHVQRNEKEKGSENFSQNMPLDLRRDDGTYRRTEEEAEREQARDSKIDVTCAIVPKSRQKPDWGEQNR